MRLDPVVKPQIRVLRAILVLLVKLALLVCLARLRIREQRDQQGQRDSAVPQDLRDSLVMSVQKGHLDHLELQ